MTTEEFLLAIETVRNALDTEGLEKNLDLEIAARHNLRRKLRMSFESQFQQCGAV